MAQAHLVSNTAPSKWRWALAALSLGAIALVWWTRGPTAQQAEPAVAPAPVAPLMATPPAATAEPVNATNTMAQAAPEASSPDAAALVQQQMLAAKEIERQPDMKPLVGPIKDKPAFVSDMEWAMLQGAAQQHADPQQELTRLVNFLRFNKQLESWEGLPKSADAGRRQVLASQLLEDLPQRVANGEMELKAAQQTQAALLKDAVPDAQVRRQRAAQEARRLTQAVPPQ